LRRCEYAVPLHVSAPLESRIRMVASWTRKRLLRTLCARWHHQDSVAAGETFDRFPLGPAILHAVPARRSRLPRQLRFFPLSKRWRVDAQCKTRWFLRQLFVGVPK